MQSEGSSSEAGGLTYKSAGVDVAAGEELVKRLAAGAVPDIGGFGGVYDLGDTSLVASTDGVGTKLDLAREMEEHSTIGIDLVAMSVNDVLAQGASPLFFLDYISTSELNVSTAEKIIEGISHGCQLGGCKLLGGETAEMPGFYSHGQYDLCGFCVGSAPKGSLFDTASVEKGDRLVGIRSSGLHSNGFSLARKALHLAGVHLSGPFGNTTVGEALMAPTRIYFDEILSSKSLNLVKSVAHITGGGLVGNVPRALPAGLNARIDTSAWQVPSIFRRVQEAGEISDEEMMRSFNMGIGVVLVCGGKEASTIVEGRVDGIQKGEAMIIGDVEERSEIEVV